MQKTFLSLMFSSSLLFSNTLTGTWSLDEKKSEISLNNSTTKEQERMMAKLLLFPMMKSLICSGDKTCIYPEMSKLGNVNQKPKIFKWKKKGSDYLIINKDKIESQVKFIDDSHMKVLIDDNRGKKIEFFYSLTSKSFKSAKQVEKEVKEEREKEMSSIELEYNKVYRSEKINTYGLLKQATPVYFYLAFTKDKEYYSLTLKEKKDLTFSELKEFYEEKEKSKYIRASSGTFGISDDDIETTPGFSSYIPEENVKIVSDNSGFGSSAKPSFCNSIMLAHQTLECYNGISYKLIK